MYVIKRDNEKQDVHFDKITERIKKLINPVELQSSVFSHLNISNETKYLDAVVVAQKVVASLYPGITTEELDLESSNICVNLSTTHPSYANLGGRILVSNLHKKTLNTFVDKMTLLKEKTDIIDNEWYEWIKLNESELNAIVDYNRDYIFDYFGFKTLERSYLLKIDNNIVERPQDIFMRVATDLNAGNMDMVRATYDLLSLGYYIHASPTLYNCGTVKKQLSSCFLLGTEDSLEEISKTWNSCAQISKWAGGIGLHVSNIRGKNSLIKGTSGKSNGLVPFLRVFNDIARWIDQGGRRPGSIAIYLEPYHPDIFDFLDLKKNFGAETERTRDLFLSLWICDLFMKQVDIDGDWYLMSSDECPGLPDIYGEEFESLYWSYVSKNMYRSKIKARKLWMAILDAQIETGTPYIGFKDHVNNKCNQKNIGTIKSSNLCHEITEYSDANEYAVCNLASIAVNQYIEPFNNNDNYIVYIKEGCPFCVFALKYMDSNKMQYTTSNNIDEIVILLETVTYPQIFNKTTNKLIGGWNELYRYVVGTYDYDKLYKVAYTATINLDRVIDINYYPVPQAKLSNMKHRPIGLGIQGLADAMVKLKIPVESQEALDFNSRLMETIYLGSMTASNDIAEKRYSGMRILCESKENYPDFYDNNFTLENDDMNTLYHVLRPNKYELIKTDVFGSYSTFNGSPFSKGIFQFDFWNIKPYYSQEWEVLRENVIKYGTRNSLLTALMPTAATSQILGNNECFEPFTNNIYTRRTLAGEFPLVNKYLVSDLINIGLWNNNMKDMILANNGSISSIDSIPKNIKELYKTMWEIKQVWVLKSAHARSPFVDQTQSMNIFMANPDYQRLGSSHFWAWKNGLKTGMYYLRSKPSVDAIKFTVAPEMIKQEAKEIVCDINNCESCSG